MTIHHYKKMTQKKRLCGGLIHDGEFPTPAEHESTHPKKNV